MWTAPRPRPIQLAGAVRAWLTPCTAEVPAMASRAVPALRASRSGRTNSNRPAVQQWSLVSPLGERQQFD